MTEDEISKILDNVVLALAHGKVHAKSIQSVAKSLYSDIPQPVATKDTQLFDAIVSQYYKNLGLDPKGGCTNCGPPGWHAMPSPNI